ncbi:MAG TPA: DUF3090 family protein [Dehalococcoidia bacterium]
MAESSNDFGPVEGVGAEAVGQPGQRTFRLVASGRGRFASLWMEKEQLIALGTALQQQIVRLGRPALREQPARLISGGDLPARADVDFRCGQLGLGFDEARSEFVVFAYNAEIEETETAAWSGRLSVAQARALSREIEAVVNAGRPKCPLCGAVMDGPVHVCPRANGHARELSNG